MFIYISVSTEPSCVIHNHMEEHGAISWDYWAVAAMNSADTFSCMDVVVEWVSACVSLKYLLIILYQQHMVGPMIFDYMRQYFIEI